MWFHLMSGYSTNRDLAAWSDDKFRVVRIEPRQQIDLWNALAAPLEQLLVETVRMGEQGRSSLLDGLEPGLLLRIAQLAASPGRCGSASWSCQPDPAKRAHRSRCPGLSGIAGPALCRSSPTSGPADKPFPPLPCRG